MPYVPNPTQATEPIEGREVVTAAREFRELKGSVNTRVAALQLEIDTEEVTRAVADAALNVRTTALEQQVFAGGVPGARVVKEFIATAGQTVFVLNFAPTTVSSVEVFVNGIYQNRSTYGVIDKTVTLTEGVAAGSAVEIAISVPLNECIGEVIVGYSLAEEIQVATEGQTVFTLTTMTYYPGRHNLSVFVNGINQYSGSAYSFTETDINKVTFDVGLSAGMQVKFTTATPVTGGIAVSGNKIIVRNSQTPASATAVGEAGTIAWDINYVYVCVAANTWRRAALAAW